MTGDINVNSPHGSNEATVAGRDAASGGSSIAGRDAQTSSASEGSSSATGRARAQANAGAGERADKPRQRLAAIVFGVVLLAAIALLVTGHVVLAIAAFIVAAVALVLQLFRLWKGI